MRHIKVYLEAILGDLQRASRKPDFWLLLCSMGLLLVLDYKWQDWFDWYWPYFMFEFRYHMTGVALFLPLLLLPIRCSWRTSITLWSLALIFIMPVIVHYNSTRDYINLSNVLTNTIFLFIPILVVTIIALLVNWRKVLLERDKERQAYVHQIIKAQEDERQRIAQELHDDTIQSLVAIASDMSTRLSTEIREDEATLVKDMLYTRERIIGTVEELRRLCFDLRPAILDTIGLLPALNWMTDKLTTDSGISIRLITNGEVRQIANKYDVIVFRIIQESLNNIRKHSNAHKATITLNCSAGQLNIIIQDDGAGFVVPESLSTFSAYGKLGLNGIYQRTQSLNGALDIKSQVGKGTTVSINVPIEL